LSESFTAGPAETLGFFKKYFERDPGPSSNGEEMPKQHHLVIDCAAFLLNCALEPILQASSFLPKGLHVLCPTMGYQSDDLG
jgi:hypothetical protein